jgi:hypothetical protein
MAACNAAIAIGFAQYDLKEGRCACSKDLFDATKGQEMRRLPELFCGFIRNQVEVRRHIRLPALRRHGPLQPPPEFWGRVLVSSRPTVRMKSASVNRPCHDSWMRLSCGTFRSAHLQPIFECIGTETTWQRMFWIDGEMLRSTSLSSALVVAYSGSYSPGQCGAAIKCSGKPTILIVVER